MSLCTLYYYLPQLVKKLIVINFLSSGISLPPVLLRWLSVYYEGEKLILLIWYIDMYFSY